MSERGVIAVAVTTILILGLWTVGHLIGEKLAESYPQDDVIECCLLSECCLRLKEE